MMFVMTPFPEREFVERLLLLGLEGGFGPQE